MAKCMATDSGVMGQMLPEAAAQASAQGPAPYCLSFLLCEMGGPTPASGDLRAE